MKPAFSKNAAVMKTSDIRELLKIIQRPGMISFAGGLPSPQTFPSEDVRKIIHHIMSEETRTALQYSPTEGYDDFRKIMAKYMANHHVRANPENIMATTGAQQGLDISAKTFLNPGDEIVVGLPAYLGAIQAYRAVRPKFIGVPIDENGMKTEVLETKLKKHKPKIVYTVPSFQNPVGVTMPAERRKHLLELASKHNFVIVEDNPYSELRYEGKPVRPIKHWDKEGRVIYLGSMSKVLSPGFRVGWIDACEEIRNKFVILKQSIDLCSSTFSQHVAHRFIETGKMNRHIKKIRPYYKRKRNAMLDALEDHLEGKASWTRPEGGMFLWLTFAKRVNGRKLNEKCIKNKVAFVPGDAFFVNNTGKNHARFNYSYPTNEKIEVGVKRIAKLLK